MSTGGWARTDNLLSEHRILNPTVSHTLQIKVLGTKNASSSGTRVDVDAFVVVR